MKKNSPVYMILFLTVLGIICAGLLSGVNALTKGKIAENEQKKLEQSLEALNIQSPVIVDVEYVSDDIKGVYEGSYSGNGESVSCYVFEVEQKNKFTTFTTLVAISKDGSLLAITPKGSSGFTTHGMDASFIGNNFGIIGSTSDNFASNFQGVSGATYSSGSIKGSIELSYEQFNKIGGNN